MGAKRNGGCGKTLKNPATGAAFPGNQIPVSMFDSAGFKLASTYLPDFHRIRAGTYFYGVPRQQSRRSVDRPHRLQHQQQAHRSSAATIYIREEAALAIRQRLVPHADVLTPNLFELGWLTGKPAATTAEAIAAARLLGKPGVIVTSAPASTADRLANLLVEETSTAACVCLRQTVHARGTGDFFAAIFLAHRLNGLSNRAALQAASAAMSLVLAASEGRAELALIETQAEWARQPPPLARLTPPL